MKKIIFFLVLCFFIPTQAIFAIEKILDHRQHWLEGSKDCFRTREPSIQVQELNEDTYVLRESPCVHLEAPFMYLLFGKSNVLLQDTGIPSGIKDFPIQTTVQNIIERWQKRHNIASLKLLVTHSHSHSDHIGGDYQFRNKARTTVVGTELKDIIKFFNFLDWPNNSSQLDLGGRQLEVIPIPGHHKTHIAMYDYNTKILFTGDTLYPGRLYIEDWEKYQNSIKKLVRFAKTHPISYILGTHIEMSNEPYTDIRYEVTDRRFQHCLQLSYRHLLQLHYALQKMGNLPRKKAYPDFIIEPL